MPRKRNFILVVLGLALLLGIGLLINRKEAPEQLSVLLASVHLKGFSVTVDAVGELDAARSTVLFSQIRGDRGKIVWIIGDGTKVKKNDVLARLDPTFFEEEVARLTAEARQFEAVVSANEQILEWEKIQAEREIKTAEFDLEAARLDLIKLEKGDGPLELMRLEGAAQEANRDFEESQGYLADLAILEKQGYANLTEIAQARNKATEAKAAYEVAKRQLESYRDFVLPSLLEKARAQVARSHMNLEQTKRGVGFKIGKAMAALRKAQQDLESASFSLKVAQTELDHTVIHAPIPGIAVLPEEFRGGKKRKARIGDVVWQGQPLVYLPDISQMVVKTLIREIDLHKVTTGNPAVVLVDAYPDLRLPGLVQSVGVLAESRSEAHSVEKYFQVVISIEAEDERLRPGMTARIAIECGKVNNKLCVPISALFHENGSHYCYVDVEASYEKRKVSVGLQNDDWAEILSGLFENDRVALSPPPSLEIRSTKLNVTKGR